MSIKQKDPLFSQTQKASKSNIQKVHAPMIIYENVIDKFSEQHEIFDIQ